MSAASAGCHRFRAENHHHRQAHQKTGAHLGDTGNHQRAAAPRFPDSISQAKKPPTKSLLNRIRPFL